MVDAATVSFQKYWVLSLTALSKSPNPACFSFCPPPELLYFHRRSGIPTSFGPGASFVPQLPSSSLSQETCGSWTEVMARNQREKRRLANPPCHAHLWPATISVDLMNPTEFSGPIKYAVTKKSFLLRNAESPVPLTGQLLKHYRKSIRKSLVF